MNNKVFFSWIYFPCEVKKCSIWEACHHEKMNSTDLKAKVLISMGSNDF